MQTAAPEKSWVSPHFYPTTGMEHPPTGSLLLLTSNLVQATTRLMSPSLAIYVEKVDGTEPFLS